MSLSFEEKYQAIGKKESLYEGLFITAKGVKKNIILLERFTTKLGPMYIAATNKGVCLLEFTDCKMLESEFQSLRQRLKAVILPGQNSHIQLGKREVKQYLAGKLKKFTVQLDAPGTDFQQSVWKMLQTIPYGVTRSYAEQAKELGNPQAIRAVARANGMNRIALIIPCHRVIGSDGSLTGYAGGLPRKEWLLKMEQQN